MCVCGRAVETRGSERETSSIFLSFIVLCFKYRIGPVGGGRRREGGREAEDGIFL